MVDDRGEEGKPREPAGDDPGEEGKPRESAGKKAVQHLTPDELTEGLRLHSKALVDEIHSIALRLIQAEEQRETRLDSKAQGLLATVGLSVTIAFTFGSLLLQHPEYLQSVHCYFPRMVAGLYGIALSCGLLASFLALRALLVRGDYKNVSERDVFNKKELSAAEEEAEKDEDKAGTRYRRYLTVQLFLIAQQHYRIHEEKAGRIKWGQRLFIVFLVVLFLIGGAMTVSVFVRSDSDVRWTEACANPDPPAVPGGVAGEGVSTNDPPASFPKPPPPPPTSIPSGGVPVQKDGVTVPAKPGPTQPEGEQ